MIAIGTLLVALTIYRLNNSFLGLAVVWAFPGIAIKRQVDYRTILITAVIAMIIISIVTLWGFLRRNMV